MHFSGPSVIQSFQIPNAGTVSLAPRITNVHCKMPSRRGRIGGCLALLASHYSYATCLPYIYRTTRQGDKINNSSLGGGSMSLRALLPAFFVSTVYLLARLTCSCLHISKPRSSLRRMRLHSCSLNDMPTVGRGVGVRFKGRSFKLSSL